MYVPVEDNSDLFQNNPGLNNSVNYFYIFMVFFTPSVNIVVWPSEKSTVKKGVPPILIRTEQYTIPNIMENNLIIKFICTYQ